MLTCFVFGAEMRDGICHDQVFERIGELTILFGSQRDGPATLGFEFRYGAESKGPPREICEIVEAAVEIMEPWYQSFQATSRKPGHADPSGSSPPPSTQT